MTAHFWPGLPGSFARPPPKERALLPPGPATKHFCFVTTQKGSVTTQCCFAAKHCCFVPTQSCSGATQDAFATKQSDSVTTQSCFVTKHCCFVATQCCSVTKHFCFVTPQSVSGKTKLFGDKTLLLYDATKRLCGCSRGKTVPLSRKTRRLFRFGAKAE